MPEYGSQDYWNARYKFRPEAFEWFCAFREIFPIIDVFLRPFESGILECNVLIPGCGTSKLGLDIRNDYTKSNITCMDFSGTLVDAQRLKYGVLTRIFYVEKDVVENTATKEYDFIIDKALMDAMLCCENGQQQAKQYLRNALRALKPTGVLIILTHSDQESREELISAVFRSKVGEKWFSKRMEFKVEMHDSEEEDKLFWCLFVTRDQDLLERKLAEISEMLPGHMEELREKTIKLKKELEEVKKKEAEAEAKRIEGEKIREQEKAALRAILEQHKKETEEFERRDRERRALERKKQESEKAKYFPFKDQTASKISDFKPSIKAQEFIPLPKTGPPVNIEDFMPVTSDVRNHLDANDTYEKKSFRETIDINEKIQTSPLAIPVEPEENILPPNEPFQMPKYDIETQPDKIMVLKKSPKSHSKNDSEIPVETDDSAVAGPWEDEIGPSYSKHRFAKSSNQYSGAWQPEIGAPKEDAFQPYENSAGSGWEELTGPITDI